MADPDSASDRRVVGRPGESQDGRETSGEPGTGSRPGGEHDLALVSVSPSAVRFRTRLRLRVGRVIAYALETPQGRTVLSGQVLGSNVVAIGADGLTFEIDVSLDRPFPPLSGAGLTMVRGRGAASSAETGPTLTFVALDSDEGPDLEALTDMSAE
jgi:hypothetical protein